MPRMRKKSELPSKTCLTCGRPFVWRKKWERDWEQVKYCSDACRSRASNTSSASNLSTSPRTTGKR